MGDLTQTTRLISGAVVISVLLIVLGLMYLGWRRRQRRQSAIARPLPVPQAPGEELFAVDSFYVASTIADEPLNRIAVAGLGYRARAFVTVFETGVVLGIAGEADVFIPSPDLVEVTRATWTIDRVVEREGLVKITWHLGSTIVDSYLRVPEPTDPSELIGAIESIIAVPEGTGNGEM
ncbi:MAG: hypothetical protein H7146_00890 [Burkholderiaceae bacterium]|nr:hypothetical protein [Microbacteriaceae bacterium]